VTSSRSRSSGNLDATRNRHTREVSLAKRAGIVVAVLGGLLGLAYRAGWLSPEPRRFESRWLKGPIAGFTFQMMRAEAEARCREAGFE
jgi:hypothetical protein